MDRPYFYALMQGTGTLDYEVYLNTAQLLSCQKDPTNLANPDEMQFQLIHQMQELSMKLIAFTLLEIDDLMADGRSYRILTLFHRVHLALKAMIDQLALLETMSPLDYQKIRVNLGKGSGQESPGFRVLLKMPPHLWQSYKQRYLNDNAGNLEQVYDLKYSHDDAYAIAEALAEYDELFQKFRFHHIQLIYRTIGMRAASLKGRSVQLLNQGLQTHFFPALWEIRNEMSNRWVSNYGTSRPPMRKPSTSE